MQGLLDNAKKDESTLSPYTTEIQLSIQRDKKHRCKKLERVAVKKIRKQKVKQIALNIVDSAIAGASPELQPILQFAKGIIETGGSFDDVPTVNGDQQKKINEMEEEFISELEKYDANGSSASSGTDEEVHVPPH